MGLVVGMIGLTHPHSAMYLRTLDALDRAEEVALFDSDPDAGERALQLCQKAKTVDTDLTAFLARPDVPIVLVALPTDVLPDVVIQAARAGKHIFCEKPCARTAAEMQPVLHALAEHRVELAVAYMWRTNPAIRKMREVIAAGALGRLTSVELRMVTTQVRLRDPSHWLFKRDVAGGGILSWLGCHWLDLLRYVSGQEVTQVCALTDTLSGEAIDVEDVATVSMRLSGGALVSLHAGYLLRSGRPGYEGARFDQAVIFRGSDGTVCFGRDGEDHVVTLESAAPAYRTAPQQVYRFSLPSVPAYGGAHGLVFFDDFVRRALTGDGVLWASAIDALRVLEILDAIDQSVRTEQVVRLARDPE